MTQPRILVRTLPLEDGNYGGILQAYALQRVLRSLGADPVTDLSRVDKDPTLKSLVRKLAVAVNLAPASWAERVRHDRVGLELSSFVHRTMSTVRLFELTKKRRATFLGEMRLLLVGSDQVWRRNYADVPSYMFDFVPDGVAPMASYAASFGAADLEGYTSSETDTNRLRSTRDLTISELV